MKRAIFEMSLDVLAHMLKGGDGSCFEGVLIMENGLPDDVQFIDASLGNIENSGDRCVKMLLESESFADVGDSGKYPVLTHTIIKKILVDKARKEETTDE